MNAQTLLVAVSFVLITGLAATCSPSDQAIDRGLYCQMVEAWTKDKARGLPPEDRAGWPPYKGPCS